MNAVYDAGALIAADRNDRRIWADHRVRLEAGTVPVTTAPAVAQASRLPRQVQLHRFLRGCRIVPFDDAHAHEIGALLARAEASDVVDAHVVLVGAQCSATIWTSNPDDLARLARQLAEPPPIRAI